jgi:hypothetical protein
MNDLLSIIYRPRFEFKAVKDNQVNYIVVLLILVLLTIIQAVVSFPVQEQLMAHKDIFAHMPDEQAQKAKSVMEIMKYVGLLFTGIFVVIKILVQALCVWGGVSIFKGKINYKQSLLVVSLISFIAILGTFINAGIIFYSGIEKIASLGDLYKTGVNLFFHSDAIGLPLYTLLAYINPFQVWAMIIMIIGLKVVGDMQWTDTIILCLILCLLWVSFPVISAVLSQAAMAKAGF